MTPASDTRRLIICRFTFVVLPQLPDCSPSPISSMPEPVYVLGMSDPYAAISVHVAELLGSISVQTDPGSGVIGV